ncbi:Pycsar system effector family protein [Streptomyces sp. SCL15-6]|uniref:Pycsar system effector family protein n=1 Tax=Streptomyces sp. SCL15-6 TaxID=2967222 RepID=UPI00296655B6|nr:Pycsar system effector family protein [Streptomyces sp. SCL15-6]
MFTEVQRADTKATTLCGVAGGLLAVDAAVLSGVPKSAWLPVAALVSAAVFLGLALFMAMVAIRPVLPREGGLRAFASPFRRHRASESLHTASVAGMDEQVCTETERLELFMALAHQKFRAVKWAVDFTATALFVAGIGLLLLYLAA